MASFQQSVADIGGNMELEQAIHERRAIRKYNDRPVEKEIIIRIIEAGTWAPSACNVQGWKFIVINDVNIIRTIVKMGAATFLNSTKQAIMVLYDNQTDNLEYNDYIQSASACIQNMLLEAHSLGVGTCWVNNLPTKNKLRKLLSIPKQYSPIALISLGYYDQQINKRPRKCEVEENISYNTFDFNVEKKKNSFKLGLKRFARKIYKHLPFKNTLLRVVGKLEKKFDN